ncbi:F-box/kelch-repeat protein SKIP25 [Glycine soja]
MLTSDRHLKLYGFFTHLVTFTKILLLLRPPPPQPHLCHNHVIFSHSHYHSSSTIQFHTFDPISATWLPIPPHPPLHHLLLHRHPSFLSCSLSVQSVFAANRLILLSTTSHNLSPTLDLPPPHQNLVLRPHPLHALLESSLNLNTLFVGLNTSFMILSLASFNSGTNLEYETQGFSKSPNVLWFTRRPFCR